MPLNPSKGLLVYTDGSYGRAGAGGWSWVAVDAFGDCSESSGAVPPPTTNNRMEMQGMIEAMISLHEAHGSVEMQIVSDSAYVVLGCQFPERKREANKDLWKDLDAAIELHDYVEWRHVRGHVGIPHNERADELAVNARKGATWKV